MYHAHFKTMKSTRFIFLFLLLIPATMQAQTVRWQEQLSQAAITLTKDQVTYDPTYFRISYPMGDVPAGKGVCTDVIIRAYRKLGVDLQALVHTDMQAHFGVYPKRWGLKKTDSNIVITDNL